MQLSWSSASTVCSKPWLLPLAPHTQGMASHGSDLSTWEVRGRRTISLRSVSAPSQEEIHATMLKKGREGGMEAVKKEGQERGGEGRGEEEMEGEGRL